MYKIAWRFKDHTSPSDVSVAPKSYECVGSCRRRLRRDFNIWAKDEMPVITDDKIVGDRYIIVTQFEDEDTVYYILEDMGMNVLVKERYRR